MADDKFSDLFDRIVQRAKASDEWQEDLGNLLNELQNSDDINERAVNLLKYAQIAREKKVLLEDEALCVINHSVFVLANDDFMRKYESIFSDRYKQIYKKYGLSDEEEFGPEGEPEELQALDRESDQKEEEILVNYFCFYGEDKIADLYLRDRTEFSRRIKAGKKSLSMKRILN